MFGATVAALAACNQSNDDQRISVADSLPSVAPAVVVDSALPMDVLISRFQEKSGPRPDSLVGASVSRDDLVRRYVRALASADTLALRSMAISRVEYAYLVFPRSAMAYPPYELNPEVAWLMLQLESEKGVVRALAFGRAEEPSYAGHECPKPPATERGVTRWRECLVTVRTASGTVRPTDLVGEIVVLDGRYKILSFANTL